MGLMHLASVSPHKQFLLLLRQTARQPDVGRDWGEGEGRGGGGGGGGGNQFSCLPRNYILTLKRYC